VRLRKPLERAVRSGHPWLFRDALEPFDAAPGSALRVLDRSGRFLAVGLAEAGPIGVRIFSLHDRAVDAGLFRERIARAFALRARVRPAETDAYRLLHGEGDLLPGFVCDRYAAAAVLKLDGEAAQQHADSLVAVLVPELEALGITSLLLRTSRKQQDS
jgi:23S rRNA (cytosine1962-C5)-methyltransferase